MNNTADNKKNKVFLILFSCLAVYIIIWCYTGQWPWANNPYNSYVLQAKAWLGGHTDLGKNYSHLELAYYNGKYYVSFPPVPSVILFPFVIMNIPDGFAALTISLAAAVYTWRLCLKHSVKSPEFWTLFLVLASNILLVSVNAWVWFLAQNISFLLTIMSIFYAVSKKGIPSLAFWALAVGCRPFQIVYLPLLLFILSDGYHSFKIQDTMKWLILPAVTAAAYMLYNYIRFDSFFEFGHNYLPEFLEAEHGQFHPSYIPGNLKSLIRLPDIGKNGAIIFPEFNGMSVFLCFPIVIFCIFYAAKQIKNTKVWLGLITVLIQLLLITSHKTMGGYHFGNRYFIDVMPCLFYIMLVSMQKEKSKPELTAFPLFLFGLALNITGIINMFINA